MKISGYLILRMSIGFAFGYAGISALLHPDNWIGYLPGWINSILPANIFLLIYSLGEIGLAIWLISGIKTLGAALLACAMLLGIIVFNFSDLMIVFRDITIFGACLALAKLSTEKHQ